MAVEEVLGAQADGGAAPDRSCRPRRASAVAAEPGRGVGLSELRVVVELVGPRKPATMASGSLPRFTAARNAVSAVRFPTLRG